MKLSTFAALLGLGIAARADVPAKVTYSDHIAPIFRNVCTNCHNPDKKKAGLDLTTYQGTLAGGESGPAVKPGNADGSLMFKVCAQTEEPKMPPKGDKLSDAELGLLKNWIAGFALENASSKPAAVQQNNVAAAVVSLSRPDGPPPMPGDLPLEPFVKARGNGTVMAMAASPWAPLVAIGGQRQIFLYHTETMQPLGVLAFPEGFPNVLRFSRNAKLLLAGGGLGGKSGTVVMWDVASGERVGSVGNETDAVLAADVSPDHQFVALGGPDKRVKLYQTKDGKMTGLIKKHTDWVTAIAFSPDGKYLATADRSGGVEVWEAGAEPKPFNTLAGHKAAVTSLAFMPGVLASGSEDGKVTLWNVKDGTEQKGWAAHPGGVLWVDFTPDGRLVSCGRDKIAKVWDATGKMLAATEAFGDLALRATMNGERMIAADYSGAIRVFALAGDKVNKVGELSANPPGIAEQLARAEKALADTQAAQPALQKALADTEAKIKAEQEAAEAKRKTDLAAAEARKAESAKQLEIANAAPAAAEKTLADITAQIAGAKEAVKQAQATVAEKMKAPDAPAIEAAKAALAEAQKKPGELQPQLQQALAALSKTKAEAPKQAADAGKNIAAADAEIQKLQQPATLAPSPAAAQKATGLAKKLEAQTAELAALRAEHAKLGEGSAGFKDLTPKIQAKRTEITTTTAELEAAKQAAAQPQPNENQQQLAKAKADLTANTARIAATTDETTRWKRAQIYQTVFNAKQTVADKQAKLDDATATAKDAFRQAELTKQGLTAAQETVAGAAKLVADKEHALATAKQTAAAAKAAIAAAEKAVADKKVEMPDTKKTEAEIAEFQKQLAAVAAPVDALRAERKKFQEGTTDYLKADAAVQAKKTEVKYEAETARLTAALADAQARLAVKPEAVPVPPALVEAVKKAQLDAQLAEGKIAPAEKLVADAKKTIEDAKAQIPQLQTRIPQLEAEAIKTKAQAERTVAALAKEVSSAKAEADRLRAKYEAIKAATTPLAKSS